MLLSRWRWEWKQGFPGSIPHAEGCSLWADITPLKSHNNLESVLPTEKLRHGNLKWLSLVLLNFPGSEPNSNSGLAALSLTETHSKIHLFQSVFQQTRMFVRSGSFLWAVCYTGHHYTMALGRCSTIVFHIFLSVGFTANARGFLRASCLPSTSSFL